MYTRIFGIFVIIVLCSCVSNAPVEVAQDTPAVKIIQKGQDAFDAGKYEQAIAYYDEVLKRFPDNPEVVISAQYEIAYIHYKTKKYSFARNECNEILAQYNTPSGALLPQQYRILASIVLNNVTKK